MPFHQDMTTGQVWCLACRRAGRDHDIVERDAGVTDDRSCWGRGIPNHVRQCTGCGVQDGPWVKAKDVPSAP